MQSCIGFSICFGRTLPTTPRSSLGDAKATNSSNFSLSSRNVLFKKIYWRESMKHEPFRGLEAYGLWYQQHAIDSICSATDITNEAWPAQ